MAKEIKVCDKLELFAATPPLEAVKIVISFAAENGPTDKCLLHNDVSRAYFHAKARRDVFVKIAREDWDEGDDGKCGWLPIDVWNEGCSEQLGSQVHGGAHRQDSREAGPTHAYLDTTSVTLTPLFTAMIISVVVLLKV